MTHRDSIAALLARHAYREGEYTLSSGRTTDFYLDAKQVTYRPDGAALVGQAVLDLLRPFRVQAVGGLTMGADAIVASTVLASNQEEPIPGFVVRKAPKTHGLQKWIEGILPKGKRVAIVDDVVTSGQSILQAVDRMRDAEAEVVAVVALVDRQEGGADAIRQAARGVPFLAVCTLADIRRVLRSVAVGA